MLFFVIAIALGLFGLALSSVSSGTEIGFYRVSKIRLKLDAIEGSKIARGLLWLTNRPSFFVATILVSNNFANYIFSMSLVIFAQSLFGVSSGILVETVLTLMFAPVLFVIGEMFPKYICLQAPGRVLRLVAVPLLIGVVALLPVTFFLWLINCVLSRFFGRSREIVQLSLARAELEKTLDEGKEAGVLTQAQRQLADNVFAVSDMTVKQIAVSPHNFPFITATTRPHTALALARTLELNEMPIFDANSGSIPDILSARQGLQPVGYVRTIDLELSIRKAAKYGKIDKTAKPVKLPIRELVEVSDNYSPLTALNLFQTADESLGKIIDSHKRCVGLISSEKLRDLLYRSTAY